MLPSLFSLVAGLILAVPPHGTTTHTVTQRDKRFSVEQATVHVGDVIVFVNGDVVAHNVFSSSEGFRFNLKRQAPGTEAKISFDARGVAEVRCALHPTMKLTVHVE